ncbi:MAG: CCA tRNA nucleotidyltransferase [Planctomycetaceae bacterium]
MPAVDPNRQFAAQVAARLHVAGFRALFAGGCVRDVLLERTPKDYDVATDARPDAVRSLFGHKRTHAVGASFGVVVVVPTKSERDRGVQPVEVATFRTEGPYLDGRRPEHVTFATPEEDAKRRDFTINGMFLDPIDDRVFDFVGGEADLKAGVVRAIGDPHARMSEDKLRLLRAVRFAATLDFRLDDATADAVRAMAPQLVVVSAERITQELRRMLVHEHRRRAVELCIDSELFAVIFPEVTPHERTLRMLASLDEPSFAVALACLLHSLAECLASGGRQPSESNPSDARNARKADVPRSPEAVEAVVRRLKLSNDEAERVAWLVAHSPAFDGIRRDRPSRLKRLCANPGIAELIEFVRVRTLAEGGDLSDVQFVESFLAGTPREVIDPPLLLTGGDLIALGLRPGPEFKRLLDEVRNAQLDETIATRDEAIDLARRLHAAGFLDTK